MLNGSTLFLTLKIFSSPGGIEKVGKIVGKALYAIARESDRSVCINSMHDRQNEFNGQYFPQDIFRAFGGNKIRFVLNSISAGKKCETVILSHINLLIVGYAIKLISPSTKVILFAHGIEVWDTLPAWKIKMLRKCDLILPVSNFTKEKMISLYDLPADQFRVLNNCLDPFLPFGNADNKTMLQKKYGISPSDKVVLTLTRLSAKEKYKGYDQVLQSIKELSKEIPQLKYLLIGKYDEECKSRLDQVIEELDIKTNVILTDYIPDAQIADHFSLADVYVMPSVKEGFGIVFIEAMYYGLPVIAGNKDGSVDALLNGELGILVDPENKPELTSSIKKVLSDNDRYIPDRKKLLENFSYSKYKEKLKMILAGN